MSGYWYYYFKEGRTSVESDEHPERLSTCKNAQVVERVYNLIKADRRLTRKVFYHKMDICIGLYQIIPTKYLGMRWFAVKCVPWFLMQDEEDFSMAVTTDLLQCAEIDADFLKTIITGDEVSVV